MARLYIATIALCAVFVSATLAASINQPVDSASKDAECKTPERWNELRTTYNLTTVSNVGLSLNPIEDLNLNSKIPGRLNQTATIPLDSNCVNDVGSAVFFGHRINQDQDNAVVVLYDKNGIVAGVQVRFRQGEVLLPENKYRFTEIPLFQNETVSGINYFVVTAYFVDPSIICETGRTPNDLMRLEGTGRNLYFQNGPTPADLILAPRRKVDALRVGFFDNGCFPAIGYHSFLNVSQWSLDNCEKYPPIFLTYNECADLVGFGMAWSGHSRSERFEHPSSFTLSTILGAEQAPQCILSAADRSNGGPGVTSMHVWFVDRNPRCPITTMFSSLSNAVSHYIGIQ